MTGREKDFIPRNKRFFTIPEDGERPANIDREFDIAKTRFPVVYDDEQWAKPGTLPDQEAISFAFDMVRKRNPNLVEPTMFLGAWEIEREAISMLAHLFHHPHYQQPDYDPAKNPVLGWFTDGGSSSLLQAAWTLRNKFCRDLEERLYGSAGFDRKKKRGLIREEGMWGLVHQGLIDPKKPPVVLAPIDMHFAGDKAIDVLGLGSKNIIRYGLQKDYCTDYASLAELVQDLMEDGRRIMFALANAGAVDNGRVEDVKKFTQVLRESDCDAPIIVDAAQQYMMLSLLSERYPAWDFRVEGVEAIIADPHKTDASPYPGSVILFKNKEVAYDTQNTAGYLHADDHLDYDMKTTWQLMPQLPTSRSPIGAIATWAHLLLRGKRKLTEKYQTIFDLTQELASYLRNSRYYTLICEPQTGVVPLHVKDNDDLKAQQVYHLFESSREQPRFYISYADCLRVRTAEEFSNYATLKNERPGEKISGYGGLYIQVMQHATRELVGQLIDRLDRVGFQLAKKGAAAVI